LGATSGATASGTSVSGIAGGSGVGGAGGPGVGVGVGGGGGVAGGGGNARGANALAIAAGLEGYGKIDRSRFRDLLADRFGVDDSLLMDRVFRCFDLDADNYISYEEFIKGMSVFLKGRMEEKTRFCFRVYDLNGDRYIMKEEMYQMLKNCLIKGSEEDEDGVKDLVDLILKKLDEDRDGRVSEGDWTTAIGKESLLLEAFGQCLPTRMAVEAYLATGRTQSTQRRGQHAIGMAFSPHTGVGDSMDGLASGASTPPLASDHHMRPSKGVVKAHAKIKAAGAAVG